MRQFTTREESMSEKFTVKFADGEKELLAAKRLRCQMFTEYNGDAANEQNTDSKSTLKTWKTGWYA